MLHARGLHHGRRIVLLHARSVIYRWSTPFNRHNHCFYAAAACTQLPLFLLTYPQSDTKGLWFRWLINHQVLIKVALSIDSGW